MANERFCVTSFSEGSEDMKDLLGGKGAGLAAMSNLDLPVPPGFTITTEACRDYMKNGELSEEIAEQVEENLVKLEESIGKGLGDAEDPLLVSVRSGAAVSMPGMMDTVLNLGINDEAVEGFRRKHRRRAFRLRLLPALLSRCSATWSSTWSTRSSRKPSNRSKKSAAPRMTRSYSADDFKELIESYKQIVEDETGGSFRRTRESS